MGLIAPQSWAADTTDRPPTQQTGHPHNRPATHTTVPRNGGKAFVVAFTFVVAFSVVCDSVAEFLAAGQSETYFVTPQLPR